LKTGQINFEDSNLGKYIVNLVRQEDVKTIVEIGTWNGMGSTRCIKHGLIGKKDYLFKSYECCKERYSDAILNNKDIISDKFQIILGKIVDESKIIQWFDIKTLSQEQEKWLKQDIEWMKEVPNVSHTLPTEIDLLILDGGEFSTYEEWKILAARTHYIILDDTLCLKTEKIRQEIINNGISIIDDCLTERNGYFIGKLM
jgi:hypothetical protein